MNMKSLFTFLAAFMLSFNISAHEIQEIPAVIAPDQASSFVKIALNQENSPDSLFTDAIIVNSHTIPQASAEKSSDFITALSVYLLIIIVYSIYGFKANSKNVRN